MQFDTHAQCQQLGKIFPGPTHKLLLSLMVIPDVYGPLIPNQIVFSKDCLTHVILKLSGNLEIP